MPFRAPAFEILFVFLCIVVHISAGIVLKSDGWDFKDNANVGAKTFVYPTSIWVSIGAGGTERSAVELSRQVASVTSGSVHEAKFYVYCSSARSFTLTLGQGAAATVQCSANWVLKKVLLTASNAGKQLTIQLGGSRSGAIISDIDLVTKTVPENPSKTHSTSQVTPSRKPLSSPPVVFTNGNVARYVNPDGYQHGPEGTGTYNAHRDAAAPAVLPDGRLLVVYGDTASVANATTFFFISNTALLTQPGSPEKTEEYLKDNRPVQLLPWTEAEQKFFIGGKQYIGVWPAGVTYLPAEKHVIIAYHRFEVVGGFNFKYVGQGLAKYNYTNANEALTKGIQATRINDNLFAGLDVHLSSPYYHTDGNIYFWGCNKSIRCWTARVLAAQVADESKWKWWNGERYEGVLTERKPMANVNEFSIPNVQYLPSFRAFVMVHGEGQDYAVLRWASSPAGPWTAGQKVVLPGCEKSLLDGGCYGLAVWPEPRNDRLVLTYAAYLSKGKNDNSAVRTRVSEIGVKLT